MKKALGLIVAVGMFAGAVFSEEAKSAEIKLRDVDIDGLMGVGSQLSLIATFDVRKGNLFEECNFDFYVLLESRDKEQGNQFFHCRSTHRFLEKESGYTTGVTLGESIMKCIDVRDAEYAVVVTYKGEEVGLENSLKERWWEKKELGKPIEHVLSRTSSAPYVRAWEAE
ncbi:MAG: hypothetical protein JXR25_00880 [Pontiellaceae bacterium]|nr:hypothetical protein [Pontiellaceae bacterium]MBN2783353.1 hypothetical protein [Pontiellaceae bacterium]